jgi:hypothetical protein
MSSAMIYGLLPVFLVRVLGARMASVGLIEGRPANGLQFQRNDCSGHILSLLVQPKPHIVNNVM